MKLKSRNDGEKEIRRTENDEGRKKGRKDESQKKKAFVPHPDRQGRSKNSKPHGFVKILSILRTVIYFVFDCVGSCIGLFFSWEENWILY